MSAEGSSVFLSDINQQLVAISKNHVTHGLTHMYTYDRPLLWPLPSRGPCSEANLLIPSLYL